MFKRQEKTSIFLVFCKTYINKEECHSQSERGSSGHQDSSKNQFRKVGRC